MFIHVCALLMHAALRTVASITTLKITPPNSEGSMNSISNFNISGLGCPSKKKRGRVQPSNAVYRCTG